VYDIRYTNGVLARYNEHSACVYKVGFSPDGKALVSAADDCTVHVCELDCNSNNTAHAADASEADFVENSGRLAQSGVYKGHSDYVRALSWQADGVLSGSWDGTVHAWAPVDMSP
jgi:WD40 repeat protein